MVPGFLDSCYKLIIVQCPENGENIEIINIYKLSLIVFKTWHLQAQSFVGDAQSTKFVCNDTGSSWSFYYVLLISLFSCFKATVKFSSCLYKDVVKKFGPDFFMTPLENIIQKFRKSKQHIWLLWYHSSEIRGLFLMKCFKFCCIFGNEKIYVFSPN